MTKATINNIELHTDGTNFENDFIAPVDIYQSDLLNLNSNTDQKFTFTKVINNNVAVHRYSNGNNYGAATNVEHIGYEGNALNDDYNGIVGIDSDDEFDINSNTDQVGSVTKSINNNVKIFFRSEQN